MEDIEKKPSEELKSKPFQWKFFIGVEAIFLAIISGLIIYYSSFFFIEHIEKPPQSPDRLIGKGLIVSHLAISTALVILMKSIAFTFYFRITKWNFIRYILFSFLIYITILFYHVNHDVDYNHYNLTDSNFPILISFYFIISLLFDRSEIIKYRSEYTDIIIKNTVRIKSFYKDMVFLATINILAILVWVIFNLFRVVY